MTNKEAIVSLFKSADQREKNLLSIISALAQTALDATNLKTLGFESILANLVEPESPKEGKEPEKQA